MYAGSKVYIRKMQHEDAPFVLEWENNPEIWAVSEGEGPYCIEDILNLVETIEDIQSSCQVRYIIFNAVENRPVGTVDLFNIDFVNRMAGVGILVAEISDRNLGYGKESLSLIEKVALELGLDRLEARVHTSNVASKTIFHRCNYRLAREESLNGAELTDQLVLEKCLKKSY